jgi:hypothetical protein
LKLSIYALHEENQEKSSEIETLKELYEQEKKLKDHLIEKLQNQDEKMKQMEIEMNE